MSISVRVPTPEAADLLVLATGLEDLYRLWRSAKAGSVLPHYEDVALGSLGKFADRIALIKQDELGIFRVVRAGAIFEKWFDQGKVDVCIEDLRPECALALGEVIGEALRLREPARTLAHVVSDGIVATYDIAAFPLESRWGPPVILVYMQDRDERYSLIDTMFRATDDGMLALKAIRNKAGSPIDFQIISVNDGACRLLGRSYDELQWKRLSDIDLLLEEHGVLNEFRTALNTGERKSFELSYSGASTVRHFKIGVSPIKDLLSVALTDIAGVKARDASFRLLFDSNPVPMWLFDVETLRFLQVNDAAVRHYGYSREAFLGMSVLDIRPEETREAARTVLQGAQDVYEADIAWRHIKADGSHIEVYPYLRAWRWRSVRRCSPPS